MSATTCASVSGSFLWYRMKNKGSVNIAQGQNAQNGAPLSPGINHRNRNRDNEPGRLAAEAATGVAKPRTAEVGNAMNIHSDLSRRQTREAKSTDA